MQPVKEAYNEQHKEWVKFQQGLQVDGFDTGQTLAVTKSAMTGTKARGGRAVRKRLLKLTEPARLQLERDKLMENVSSAMRFACESMLNMVDSFLTPTHFVRL